MSEPYTVRQYYRDQDPMPEITDLSVLIGPRSFAYAVTSADHKTLSELCDVAFPVSVQGDELCDAVRFQVNNYRLTQRRFNAVRIGVASPYFSVIPEAYADAAKARSLLQLSTGLPEVRTLRHHQIGSTGFWYEADHALESYLGSTFSKALIRHSGAVNIGLLLSAPALNAAELFLNLTGDFIEISARKGSELLFYNTFTCETNEDVLYYLLFTMEQLGLDPGLTRLLLAGDRSAADPLLESIRKYVKHTGLCVSGGLTYKGELSKLPSHAHFILLNQHQCEL